MQKDHMKITGTIARITVTVSSLLLVLGMSCLAQDARPYLKLDAGANFAEGGSFSLGGEPADFKFNTGFRVGLAGGYQLNSWAAIELESGVIANTIRSIVLNGRTAQPNNAWLGKVPLLANAVFRYENSTDFVPYVGVGAGGAAGVLNISDDDDKTIVFAYQAMAGVIYKLDEEAWVDIGYKFFANGDEKYSVGGVSVEANRVRNHFIGLSVHWRF
jgi:opacity protein-like surface antigen